MSANFSNVIGVFGSEDQHGIAIAVETVFFFDSHLVGVHDQVITSESSRHHEQGRLRHMEVGYHAIGHTEIVWRENEFVGPARCGLLFAQGGHR